MWTNQYFHLYVHCIEHTLKISESLVDGIVFVEGKEEGKEHDCLLIKQAVIAASRP